MKVPSADTAMGLDMARQNPLKPLEEKMVSLSVSFMFQDCYINKVWLRISDCKNLPNVLFLTSN